MRVRVGGFEHGMIVDKQEPSVTLRSHVQNKPSAFSAPRLMSCINTVQMLDLVAYLAGRKCCTTVER